MKKKPPYSLLISILIPLAIGQLSAFLSRNNFGRYEALEKSSLSPPAFVFSLVWTVLYILMGISFYLIWNTNRENISCALLIYGTQLLFNFLWSPIFFTLGNCWLALFCLILLIFLIVLMIQEFYRIKPLAAYLQLPYLIWCVFALYLNLSVCVLNRS